MIEIFTDGAAKGNPGPGGYGVVLKSGSHYKELSGGFVCTTNNRMELLAVILGLEAVKRIPAQITVYSDSSYVVNAINKGWVFYQHLFQPELAKLHVAAAGGVGEEIVWFKRSGNKVVKDIPQVHRLPTKGG